MAATWRKISEYFDSYKTEMYYATGGYYNDRPFDKIQKTVEEESDASRPFPEYGYPLAKTVADDIKYLHNDKNKSVKEIIRFFATEIPKKGERFVLDEFFLKQLFHPFF